MAANQELLDAAQAAMERGDQEEAGLLLLRALPAGGLDRLSTRERQLAFTAALCLGSVGRLSEAVEILLAVGEAGRAAELLEDAGREAEAQRIRERWLAVSDAGAERSFAEGAKAEASGRLEDALSAYLEAGAHGAAGRVEERLGRQAEAIELYERAGWYYRIQDGYVVEFFLEEETAEDGG